MTAIPAVHYQLPGVRPGWELSEETMPESALHDLVVTLLREILEFWAAREGNRRVLRNLAVRWDQDNPRVGVDPDVAVLSPPPPEGDTLTSLRTWLPGHRAPLLAVEVVSESNPRKDYAVAPDKYAASGTAELWVFDPLLAGPQTHGGPFLLQQWSRDGSGTLVRQYAGVGPFRSAILGAFAVPVEEGRRLRIADDAGGTSLWLTATEAERARRHAAEKERDAAMARLAALEAQLGTKR